MNINRQIKNMINENYNVIMRDCFRNIIDSKGNLLDEKIIVYDGVVNENDFLGILFLLKEAVENQISDNSKYQIKDGAFDLINTAAKESIEQTDRTTNLHWKELCEWVAVYEKPDLTYSKLESHGGNLSKVAIVNIKKVAGLSTTDSSLMSKIVKDEEYSSLLKQEIGLIKAKIVICCGTFEYAKMLYGKKIINKLDCGVEYFKEKDMVFVDFIHPRQYGAAQKPTMKFAFAKEVFGELSKKKM